MSTKVCKWCTSPEELHSIWDEFICDECLQKMADRMDPASAGVVYVGDCWRVRCPVCKHIGPGAETSAEARGLALLEEFVERDGTLVCRACYEKDLRQLQSW